MELLNVWDWLMVLIAFGAICTMGYVVLSDKD